MGSRSESLAGEATFAKKPGACGTVSRGIHLSARDSCFVDV